MDLLQRNSKKLDAIPEDEEYSMEEEQRESLKEQEQKAQKEQQEQQEQKVQKEQQEQKVQKEQEEQQKLEDVRGQVQSQLLSEIPSLPVRKKKFLLNRKELRGILDYSPRMVIRKKDYKNAPARYADSIIQKENEAIDQALSVEGSSYYYLSKAQAQELSLKKGRNESYLLVNENSRSSDSPLMTAVKNQLIDLEKLLYDRPGVWDEDFLARVGRAFNNAIEACDNYCKGRSPISPSGRKRKKLVRQTMNRLLKEKEMFEQGRDILSDSMGLPAALYRPVDLLNSGKMLFTRAEEGSILLNSDSAKLEHLKRVNDEEDSPQMQAVKGAHKNLLLYLGSIKIQDGKKQDNLDEITDRYDRVIAACDTYLEEREGKYHSEEGEYRLQTIHNLREQCFEERRLFPECLETAYENLKEGETIPLLEVYGNMRQYRDHKEEIDTTFENLMEEGYSDKTKLFGLLRSVDVVFRENPQMHNLLKNAFFRRFYSKCGFDGPENAFRELFIEGEKECKDKLAKAYNELLEKPVPVQFLKNPNMADDFDARQQFAAFYLPYLPEAVEYNNLNDALNWYRSEKQPDPVEAFMKEGVQERNLLSEEAMEEFKTKRESAVLPDALSEVSRFIPPELLPANIVEQESMLRKEIWNSRSVREEQKAEEEKSKTRESKKLIRDLEKSFEAFQKRSLPRNFLSDREAEKRAAELMDQKDNRPQEDFFNAQGQVEEYGLTEGDLILIRMIKEDQKDRPHPHNLDKSKLGDVTEDRLETIGGFHYVHRKDLTDYSMPGAKDIIYPEMEKVLDKCVMKDRKILYATGTNKELLRRLGWDEEKDTVERKAEGVKIDGFLSTSLMYDEVSDATAPILFVISAAPGTKGLLLDGLEGEGDFMKAEVILQKETRFRLLKLEKQENRAVAYLETVPDTASQFKAEKEEEIKKAQSLGGAMEIKSLLEAEKAAHRKTLEGMLSELTAIRISIMDLSVEYKIPMPGEPEEAMKEIGKLAEKAGVPDYVSGEPIPKEYLGALTDKETNTYHYYLKVKDLLEQKEACIRKIRRENWSEKNDGVEYNQHLLKHPPYEIETKHNDWACVGTTLLNQMALNEGDTDAVMLQQKDMRGFTPDYLTKEEFTALGYDEKLYEECEEEIKNFVKDGPFLRGNIFDYADFLLTKRKDIAVHSRNYCYKSADMEAGNDDVRKKLEIRENVKANMIADLKETIAGVLAKGNAVGLTWLSTHITIVGITGDILHYLDSDGDNNNGNPDLELQMPISDVFSEESDIELTWLSKIDDPMQVTQEYGSLAYSDKEGFVRKEGGLNSDTNEVGHRLGVSARKTEDEMKPELSGFVEDRVYVPKSVI